MRNPTRPLPASRPTRRDHDDGRRGHDRQGRRFLPVHAKNLPENRPEATLVPVVCRWSTVGLTCVKARRRRVPLSGPANNPIMNANAWFLRLACLTLTCATVCLDAAEPPAAPASARKQGV